MLIKRRNGELILIEQVVHAHMAAEIAAHWGNEQFAAPRPQDKACLAAAMHDDGWREPDSIPLFNEKEARPLHFLEIGMEDHVKLYGRGVDEVFAADPYAGLLVSMHWTGLYRSRWGMQAGRVEFGDNVRQDEAVLAEEQRWIDVKRELVRDQRRSDLELSLWHNYDLLQTWDLLSLYACVCDTVPDDGPVRQVFETLKSIDHVPGVRTIPSVPVSIGGERVEITLTAVERGVVAVDPYPFDVDELTVGVTAKAIPDRRYDSAEEARQAVASAREEKVGCRFVRS
ncbi:DUF3891 family protein [Pseudonocardia artemisiae]|nr:DUF3891 family protein [Pseudonocardia bannensis]